MTSCPYCGSTERPQIYPDGTLRRPMCGQLAGKASIPADQWADRPPREISDSESCPSCGSPMERGYVLGAHGVYWNDHIPRLTCTGEQLSDKGLYWGWICPSVKALRCRKCRIIRY